MPDLETDLSEMGNVIRDSESFGRLEKVGDEVQ
jgi:hypothetical protein